MPKMPEVTVHVTTEPDPQEAREYKASADMWAEQCRTLQRTLLDTQIERDALRARIDELSRAYAVQVLAIEELTSERDRYREALRSILPSQDPFEAELICDWCGEETPFDQAQGKHADNCPWLLAYGTKEPTK